MITIEPITERNVCIFKAVRLRALRDAPYAFSSTYAEELLFPQSEWLTRVERMNGERGTGFLAIDDKSPCGIVASFLDQNDPTQVQLVSMWTAPTHRRYGIGRLLVNQVIAWASRRDAQTLRLMVTSNNDPALRFYERLGFLRTGRTEPYPNDPDVIEWEMARAIP
ncbi:MAG: GNAT family N-acetyltransferase [Acidobacteria bacterium]|nr:GNAT family N-acetyltransferase [Acidobacteriota bacterium]